MRPPRVYAGSRHAIVAYHHWFKDTSFDEIIPLELVVGFESL